MILSCSLYLPRDKELLSLKQKRHKIKEAMNWSVAWILTILILLIQVDNQMAGPDETGEFCNDETFTAACPLNTVILMKEAFYGRKRIGDCIRENVGFLGCGHDVLRLVDRKCSGHMTCELSVMDQSLRSRMTNCSSEVTWHLVAKYTCISLIVAESCSSDGRVNVDAPAGYLGPVSGAITGPKPGTERCPYRLQAKPGQRFNITAFDFLTDPTPGRGSSPRCIGLGTAREATRIPKSADFTVCRNLGRRQMVYMSESHQMDIFFSDGLNFLVHFEVYGCPDPEVVTGSYLTRTNHNEALISCNVADKKWTLLCTSGEWIGQLGTCPTEEETSPWSVDDIFSPSSDFPYGILIIVAVGVALGVFLGGSLLFVASVYLKRRRMRALQQEAGDCATLPPFKPSDPTHFYRTDTDERFHYPHPKPVTKDSEQSNAAPMDLIHPSPLQKKDFARRSSCPSKDADTAQEATLFRGANRGASGVVPAQYGSNTRGCPHHYESPKFTP